MGGEWGRNGVGGDWGGMVWVVSGGDGVGGEWGRNGVGGECRRKRVSGEWRRNGVGGGLDSRIRCTADHGTRFHC